MLDLFRSDVPVLFRWLDDSNTFSGNSRSATRKDFINSKSCGENGSVALKGPPHTLSKNRATFHTKMLLLSTLLTALAFTNVASALPVAGDNCTAIEKRLPTGVNLIYFPESELDYALALKATCISMFQTYWDTIGEARPPVYPGTGTIATVSSCSSVSN